ncbi:MULTISPECIES: helix-turn-helix domain-containing protein [Fischerella]|uniref:Transcriptional regulator n=1 Tax=Fischerella muscicola CCMEE 5323 TaxID=2019572 RepID=A0A2N6JU63_FISMU|nr:MULTISPECIES: helix-turn-helix domain-containing protein [Fischerella]MBD2434966.1 helix-turn-helix domain-containing protein [Fischerella sp. FACHB-380]PLZ80784.1 transcriptional regulator [Fischerella muscicola CCMEE 5323]
MVTTPVYFLQILGNPTIEISQDELRSLLGEIEAELHNSQVYRRALATIQKLLGDSAEQGKMLLKAVGREAIGLAFRQLAQHYQKVENIVEQQIDNQPQTETADFTQQTQQDNSNNLSKYLTYVKFHTKENQENTKEENLSSQPNVVANIANHENLTAVKTPLESLKNKIVSKTELTKQSVDERRTESLRQIGQQLRQARESRGLSLEQLCVYTYISVNQMEAIENGNWELLPEDVFVRGFIRVMGNALGLNGTALAASLPAPEPTKSVLPSWGESKKTSKGVGFEIRPMHLYVGYTALVASAIGGLSYVSQQGETSRLVNQNSVTPVSSSASESLKHNESKTTPGIKSTSVGVTVGPDISPPEAL